MRAYKKVGQVGHIEIQKAIEGRTYILYDANRNERADGIEFPLFLDAYKHAKELVKLEPIPLSEAERFEQICKSMADTYRAKQHDYGNSVADTYSRYGDVSFLTRMRDKLNRLDTLCTKGVEAKVHDEKIEDTIIDLANYAILFLITREGNR